MPALSRSPLRRRLPKSEAKVSSGRMLLGNWMGSIMSEQRFRLVMLLLMVAAPINLIRKAAM